MMHSQEQRAYSARERHADAYAEDAETQQRHAWARPRGRADRHQSRFASRQRTSTCQRRRTETQMRTHAETKQKTTKTKQQRGAREKASGGESGRTVGRLLHARGARGDPASERRKLQRVLCPSERASDSGAERDRE
eukprot:3213519-Rhodomonas_salina.1